MTPDLRYLSMKELADKYRDLTSEAKAVRERLEEFGYRLHYGGRLVTKFSADITFEKTQKISL